MYLKRLAIAFLRAGYRVANRLLYGSGVAAHPPLRQLDAFVRTWMRPPVANVQGHRMVLDRLDSLRLGVFSIHEPVETSWIEQHVREGDVVVDVGANIGYFTLLLARQVGPSGHVYAFEPDPDNFALLEQNVALNGYGHVTTVQAALSDSPGTVRLYRSETNLADHRVFGEDGCREFVEVAAVRLDDYLSTRTDRLNFIKMDIQGAEGHALAGMRSLLAHYPELTVSSEFWPHGLQRAGTDPSGYLSELGGGRVLFELDEVAGTTVATSADEILRRYENTDGVTTVVAMRSSTVQSQFASGCTVRVLSSAPTL